MRQTRIKRGSVALATALIAAMFGAGGPASASAHETGVISDPFAESTATHPDVDNCQGKDFAAAAPATPQEAGCLPTAVSIAVTPDGNLVYWDGLSGLADSNVALPLDAGRTGQTPDRSRLLILDVGDLSDGWQLRSDPQFLESEPNGGAIDNLFCADQRLLADGRVVVAGGTDYETESYADLPNEVADPAAGAPDGLAELYGSKNTRLYTDTGDGGPGTWLWEQTPDETDAENAGTLDMAHGRWYPTLITQPDGNLFVVSGVSKLLWNSKQLDDRASEDAPVNVAQTETFDPTANDGAGGWTYNEGADKELPLFARLHLLTNGQVFYGGVGQYWSPAGQSINELSWGTASVYDPETQTWTDFASEPLDFVFAARSGAFSVPLMFEPDEGGAYTTTNILVAGGTLGTSPSTYLAQTLSEIQTLTENEDGTVSYSKAETGELNNARWYSSGVLLPNGQVLAISGADKDEVLQPGTESPVRTIELYDPATGTWTEMLDANRDRTYHNSAILLPDGSVLIGGHSPINTLYGGTGDNSLNALGTANNFRDPSFEIYRPPYLFNEDGTEAARPLLNPETTNINAEGLMKFVTAPTNTITPTSVTLTRLPSTTHVTDADMRGVVLPGAPVATSTEGQAIRWEIQLPDDPNVLPPGYYYAWISGETGAPAVAQIVSIGA